MTQLLAGDIGGTKTLLRLSKLTSTGLVTLHEASYPSANFKHLSPIVRQFLSEVENSDPIAAACFAIAGPVQNDQSLVTNLSWRSKNVVQFYNAGGTAEQWIKEGNHAAKWTKLAKEIDSQMRRQPRPQIK